MASYITSTGLIEDLFPAVSITSRLKVYFPSLSIEFKNFNSPFTNSNGSSIPFTVADTIEISSVFHTSIPGLKGLFVYCPTSSSGLNLNVAPFLFTEKFTFFSVTLPAISYIVTVSI